MAVRFAGPAHSRRPGCSDPHPLAVEIHRGEERARIPGRGRAQDREPPKSREEQDETEDGQEGDTEKRNKAREARATLGNHETK